MKHKNLPLHIRIEAKGAQLTSVILSKADVFSYEILGADGTLERSLIQWLDLYCRKIPPAFVYREGLKNWKLAKEAPQIFWPEREDIAKGKTRSEDEKYGAKPTPVKTNFSITSGIIPLEQCTPFQQKVLTQLSQIPFGMTLSYGELGKRCGQEFAARAVGGACKRNPFPLFIPCHRVIQGNGSIGGFALDLEIKQRLLAFEGKIFKELQS